MRSLEYLIQLFPDATGSEILEMQRKDKEQDEQNFKKAHQERIDWIDDINANGGFWKGRFGLDQHFYYKVTNAGIESGKVYGDVENITVFFGCKNSVVPEGNIKLEKKLSSFEELKNYGFHLYERITEKEYESAVKYIEDFKSFWK